MAILIKKASAMVIGFVFLSCYHVDKFVGLFDIISIRVNAKDLPFEQGQTEIVVPLAESQLLLRPVWLSGGRDLGIVIELGQNAIVDIDQFKIEASNLIDLDTKVSSTQLLPFYYVEEHGGLRKVTLPLRVDSNIRIGLIHDLPSDGTGKHLIRFTLRVSDPFEVYAIEISGYRKI
jgi:hypothetical protein